MESKIRVLIADTDVDYSSSLVRYLSEKYSNKFTIALVNKPEKLWKLLEVGYRADVLVVTVYFLKTIESKIIADFVGNFDGILVLKEGGSGKYVGSAKCEGSDKEGGLPKFHGYLGIVEETNKYQMADEIVRSILDLHTNVSKMVRSVVKIKGTGKIGIFSPVGGSGKTFLATLIAKYLASIKKKVLLLGFEDVSSLKAYFSGMPESYSSELFLGLKTRVGEFDVGEYVWTDMLSGVDILLPSASVSEPCELTAEEAERIFSMKLEGYEFVVSDLGAWDSVKAFKVLQMQDLIIFPIRDDKSSELKTLAWANFCKGFEGERFEGLLGRCVCVRMTDASSDKDAVIELIEDDFEDSALKDIGFLDLISFHLLDSQDVERAGVREFVSKLL